MTEKPKKTIHIIYSIVLSVMLAVAGICLIVACVGIYRSGSRPFTPESVAAAFATIALPVYICLGLVFGSFVLNAALPLPRKKRSAVRQEEAQLAKLHRRLLESSCEAALAQKIIREQSKRKLHSILTLVLLILGSIAFLLYGANPANFHQSEINASMVKAMYVLLPCMAIPFCYSIFAAYACRASVRRETALVKEAIASVRQETALVKDAIASGETAARPAPANKEKLPWLRYALLVFAVAILVYGFFAGGTKDVLTKAINICTECVGLG